MQEGKYIDCSSYLKVIKDSTVTSDGDSMEAIQIGIKDIISIPPLLQSNSKLTTIIFIVISTVIL